MEGINKPSLSYIGAWIILDLQDVCVCAYVMLYVFVIFSYIALINRFDELEVSSESFS